MVGPLTISPDIASSKNQTLRQIITLINDYNRWFAHPAAMRRQNQNYLVEPKVIQCLDKIGLLVMAYLLHKPPGARKESGKGKWNQVVALKDQIIAHADFFGIRFLKGDFISTTDGWNYWLERASINNTGEDVYDDYLRWLQKEKKEAFSRSKGTASGNAPDLNYFDELDRLKYEVQFDGQRFCWAATGTPLETSNSTATYSGLNNVFIYVCSAKTKKIYSAPAKDRVLHHSSFLKGEPVIAAGDWVVYDGLVLYLNASSGHYRPTVPNMHLFAVTNQRCWRDLTQLPPRKNGRLKTAVIQPTHRGKLYYIDDFITRSELASAVEPEWLAVVADTLGTTPIRLTEHA